MGRRADRVLIAPKSGQKETASGELAALAGAGTVVRPTGSEADFLAEALKPDEQSSALFSAIAVVIGMLFAYNTVLLSMAFRRRLIGYLVTLGADRSTVLAMLIFEAVALGLAASLIGIVAGDVISRGVFNSIPRYLSAGFPIGDQRIVAPATIAISILGGMAAAVAALAAPAFELFRIGKGEAFRDFVGRRIAPRGLFRSAGLWLGLAVIAIATPVVFAWPALIPIEVAAIVVGMTLAVGPITRAVFAGLHRATRAQGGIGLSIAVDELAGSARRTTALALIAAAATFATLAIGGTRLDLERGTKQLNREIFRGADLWVLPHGQENTFMTNRFDLQPVAKQLRASEDLTISGVLHGSFADIGRRRILVAAHPARVPTAIASDVVRGDPKLAIKRIRAGGWIALYDMIAREHGLGPDDWFSFATPSGQRRFRIAATIANYGWPSGVIVMNDRDFANAWHDGLASAIAVNLRPGITIDQGKREISRLLGPETALGIRTPVAAVNERIATVTQGLGRLRQISVLVLIAAILAITAAMFAAVWQRRESLASLRAIGVYRLEVYRSLYLETTLVVLLGTSVGAGLGLFAQFFVSRWIEFSGGFHAPYEPAVALGVITLLKVVALSALATTGPALLAARAPIMTGK